MKSIRRGTNVESEKVMVIDERKNLELKSEKRRIDRSREKDYIIKVF